MEIRVFELLQEMNNNQKAMVELLYIIAKVSSPEDFKDESKIQKESVQTK